jgi:hypothetical protein
VTLTWTTAGPNIGCKCKENIEIEAALFLKPICASSLGIGRPGLTSCRVSRDRPSRVPLQFVLQAHPWGCRDQEHEDHQSLSSAEGVKNTWAYDSAPTPPLKV